MNNSSEGFPLLKSTLAEALIIRLQAGEDILTISLEQLSSDTELDPELVRSFINNVFDLFIYWFDMKVSQILSRLAEDFSEDGSSTTKEKILETLMTILEAFADNRVIFKSTHEWALKEPKFGILLAQTAYQICDRILAISGDLNQDTSIARFKRFARIKGLMGMLIRIRSVWFEDASDDLSPTFRELDKILQSASEWGHSLRLLDISHEQEINNSSG